MVRPRPQLVPASPPERSDDDLLLLARGGVSSAFDELVRRHQAQGLRIAHKYLGDLTAARDVVQASFVEIYRALPRYQPRALFPAYFHRVVLNHCHMARRARRSADGLADREAAGLDLLAPASEELILARERRAAVERAVRDLRPKLRDVVVLRFAAELSYEEIARVLELPVGTVKSRLFAGMERLRELLASEGVA